MFARRTTRWVMCLGSALVLALVAGPSAMAWAWPVDGAVLRGFSVSGDTYAAGQHRGIDIALGASSAIRAPVSGEVTFARTGADERADRDHRDGRLQDVPHSSGSPPRPARCQCGRRAMSSQSLARRARRSTTSRTFISVSGSARARATSTHSNCFRLEVLPALPRHPRRRPHPFRSPRPRRRWLRALPLRRLRPLPLHLPPSPLPHPSHRLPRRHRGPAAAPRTSSGGLQIGASEPIKAASRTRKAERDAPSWRSTCAARDTRAPIVGPLAHGRAHVEKCSCRRGRGAAARSTLAPRSGTVGQGRRPAADPRRSERVADPYVSRRRRRTTTTVVRAL